MNIKDLEIKDSFNLGSETEIVLANVISKNNTTYLGCFICYNDKCQLIGFDKDYYILRKKFK